MTEQEKYEKWLSQAGLDSEVKAQLEAMKNDKNEIFESFYRNLDFGTGGLRGILGAGTNRMNVYTVGKATQGFAEYLLANYKEPSIAIAYDSRNNSEKFACVAARVMAYNGIKVYLYGELMPTPMLSFAVRHYNCQGGIVITASHNPAKYNGYKVYGADGCQIGLETADAILEYMNRIDVFSVSLAEKNDKNIVVIPDEVINEFIDTIYSRRIYENADDVKDISIAYTPLNGTGRMPFLRILKKMCAEKVFVVPEQEMPDGNFPTCPFPNPEFKEAMELAISLAEKKKCDVVIGTDPDADRMGAAVLDKGEYRLISGNEMGVLMLDYICRARLRTDTMPKSPVAVKTIVTTAMVDDVAKEYNVKLESVLTGFKFIGEIISALDEAGRVDDYLLGFEESYGYLMSDHARDKDAISAAMLVCDMVAFYKKQGKTLADVLNEMYEKYGYYNNKTVSFYFEGASGMKKMDSIMEQIRNCPPENIACARVVELSDYLLSVTRNASGEKKITLPKSNVLGFRLDDGCSFVIRPSGTEPKIKVYMFAKAPTMARAEKRVAELNNALEKLIK